MYFRNLKITRYFFTGAIAAVLCSGVFANEQLSKQDPKNQVTSRVDKKMQGTKSIITSMESRLSIVTLGVNDLAASVSFYKDGLGLNLREKDSSSYIAFFQFNGMLLALYPRDLLAEDAGIANDNAIFSGMTLAQNVGSREEVDSILALAARAGATITKKGELKDWGGYSGYFQDPNGYLWEIAWNPNLSIIEAP
jgi:catechol 2,3-dioxygenase-like lactoylglutathione lyase family enzyme